MLALSITPSGCPLLVVDRNLVRRVVTNYIGTCISSLRKSTQPGLLHYSDPHSPSRLVRCSAHELHKCLRARAYQALEWFGVATKTNLALNPQSQNSQGKITHATIPDVYSSLGGSSSTGKISNAASTPAMAAHTLSRAMKRPAHSRRPKPNAASGKTGAPGASQRSGWNRLGSGNVTGSCSIALRK